MTATDNAAPASPFEAIGEMAAKLVHIVEAAVDAKDDEIDRLTSRLTLVEGVAHGALTESDAERYGPSTSTEPSGTRDPLGDPSGTHDPEVDDDLPAAQRKLDMPKDYRSWLDDLDGVLRAQTSMTYAIYTLLALHSLRRRSEDGYELRVQGDDAPLGAALGELCQGVDALQALCIGAGLEQSPTAAAFQLQQEQEASFAHYRKVRGITRD